MTTLIIGGGVAGAAAAYVCLDAVVLEGGDRVGGRMESRERDGTVYDIGATCIRDTGDERSTLAREVLGEDCATFEGAVGTFDDDGRIGHARRGHTRLTGRHGLRQLPTRLLGADHCNCRAGRNVERLERTGDGWRAHTTDGTVAAERVVTTTGPDRTAELLPATDPLGVDLRAAADRIEHRLVDSVVLGYDHPVDRDWYALAAGGEGHDLRWLSRESEKPGHVPAGRAALVVRLGHDCAASNGPGAAPDRARRAVADLLDDERLAAPAWTDHERYRFAEPRHRIDPGLVERAAEADCYLAGDWVAGTRRTFAPLETGLDAGRRAMGFARQAALQ
jgi:predicted NAD/FAD-dependent oxidoreductase